MTRRGIVSSMVVMLGVGLSIAALSYLVVRGHGFSAAGHAGRLETRVARAARSLAIPADARRRANPGSSSPERLRAGLAHFADHCAVCHGNDGRGQTEMGRGLYPKSPDMTLPATLQLTDGELFYIIEHGVPFTGMPAWGDGRAESETASWHLVQFIRHLPQLSAEELALMRRLNPTGPGTPAMDPDDFLNGAPLPPAPVHKGHDQ